MPDRAPDPTRDREPDFFDLARLELARAREKFGPINGPHEGYAVLQEEVDELWDAVKTSQPSEDPAHFLLECVQIAAMAGRFAVDLELADYLAAFGGGKDGASLRKLRERWALEGERGGASEPERDSSLWEVRRLVGQLTAVDTNGVRGRITVDVPREKCSGLVLGATVPNVTVLLPPRDAPVRPAGAPREEPRPAPVRVVAPHAGTLDEGLAMLGDPTAYKTVEQLWDEGIAAIEKSSPAPHGRDTTPLASHEGPQGETLADGDTEGLMDALEAAAVEAAKAAEVLGPAALGRVRENVRAARAALLAALRGQHSNELRSSEASDDARGLREGERFEGWVPNWRAGLPMGPRISFDLRRERKEDCFEPDMWTAATLVVHSGAGGRAEGEQDAMAEVTSLQGKWVASEVRASNLAAELADVLAVLRPALNRSPLGWVQIERRTLEAKCNAIRRALEAPAPTPEKPSVPAPVRPQDVEPCRIVEYDGSFNCLTHSRLWGAVANPDEPCSGDERQAGLDCSAVWESITADGDRGRGNLARAQLNGLVRQVHAARGSEQTEGQP